MKAVVLAGGSRTSWGKGGKNTPRVMVLVREKPFLEYQVRFLKKYHTTDLIFCLHCLPEKIKQYFQDGKKFGANISYSIEEEPLGTAGAVKFAEKYYAKEKNIVVINADTMLDVNLEKAINFHLQNANDVTICLAYVRNVSTYGHITLGVDNRIELFGEKLYHLHTPGLVNGGIYIVKKKIMDDIAFGEVVSFEREVFPSLISLGRRVYGQVSKGPFIDIGEKTGYKKAGKMIKKFGL